MLRKEKISAQSKSSWDSLAVWPGLSEVEVRRSSASLLRAQLRLGFEHMGVEVCVGKVDVVANRGYSGQREIATRGGTW